jgi:hypothetical protein
MRPIRLCFAVVLTAAACSAAPSRAAAAPPANDNYLASTTIASSPFSEIVDTTEATTQADLFNPNAQGQPLGGAGPESTSCNGTAIGRTVWYDLKAASGGGVEVQTSAAFDQAIAVYEWNPSDSRITRLVTCQNSPGTGEDLLLNVAKGKAYTFQVGGVNGGGGPLTFKLDYFPDGDGDGVLDATDDCPTTPGVGNSGCPPVLRVSTSVNFDRVAGGLRLTTVSVAGVPKGAKVAVRAAGASQTVTAKKAGRVDLSKLVGRVAKAGQTIEVRVTLARTGTGKYRFGATGAYVKWPVKASGLGTKLTRCLHAGSGKIERCS